MEKIKIIELLNRISNGTQPKTIILDGYTYYWNEEHNNYYRHGYDDIRFSMETDTYMTARLQDYVEIIEEDKKIEKIDYDFLQSFEDEEDMRKYDSMQIVFDKINEIIDYINKENK